MRSEWKKQVASPWQTTWEDVSDEGGSKIHGYGMLPGFFLSAYVLGVRSEEPVWKKSIVIEPRPGDLSRAKGVVVTEFGPVPVAWTKTAEAMTVETTVPGGISASVRLRARTGLRQSLLVDGKIHEAKLEKDYLAVSLSAGRHRVEQFH
jgi:alpha-L-rhamnosidase